MEEVTTSVSDVIPRSTKGILLIHRAISATAPRSLWALLLLAEEGGFPQAAPKTQRRTSPGVNISSLSSSLYLWTLLQPISSCLLPRESPPLTHCSSLAGLFYITFCRKHSDLQCSLPYFYLVFIGLRLLIVSSFSLGPYSINSFC